MEKTSPHKVPSQKENGPHTKWRTNFHRRKWTQRAARKTAAGDLTANHKPEQFEDQGITKWICTKCGKCAGRPCDLGKECTGAPSKLTCRYWKRGQDNL
eukprot:8516907-Heterocapsa_arctica.AAC.1